jgi:hypothetical protein
VYRDLKNTLDTAREEALEEGRTEGRVEEKEGVARKAIPNGLSNELIQAITGLPLDVIEMIRREIEGTTN